MRVANKAKNEARGRPQIPKIQKNRRAKARKIINEIKLFEASNFWQNFDMHKNAKEGEQKQRTEDSPAGCVVPAGGKEGCTTVLNPPGFGRGVHANDLLQTLLQKIFIRRSSFRVHSFEFVQQFHTPVTLRVRRIQAAPRIPPSSL